MVNITSTTENDILKITVDGEVDASSSIELDNAIKGAIESSKKIMVDLSKLAYISSAGLCVFVSHLEDIKEDMQLVLFGLSESVMQVFELLGLQELLTIEADENAAVQRLNG